MRTIFFVLLFFVCLQSQALAQVIRQPVDLAPGDQYRLMFTTSTTRDATSTNIEDYNSFVQSVADAAPEVGSWGLTWRVVASTKDVDAIDNTATDFETDAGVPIYRIDGVRLADGNIGLWNPSGNNIPPLTDTYAVSETGVVLDSADPFTGVPVYTATSALGRATPIEEEFAEFVGLGGLDRIDIGAPNVNSGRARINWTSLKAVEPGHFYALSEVITVVPEPSGGVALCVGLFTVAWCSRRRVVALNVPESLAFSPAA